MTSRKLHPMSRYTVFTPGDCNSNLAPLALIPLDTGIAIESSDYTFFVVIPPDSVRDKVFHIPTVTEKAFYVNYGITTHLGIATACVIDPEWQVFASLIPNQRNFQTKKHEYFQWWEINQFFGGFITSLIRPYNTTRNLFHWLTELPSDRFDRANVGNALRNTITGEYFNWKANFDAWCAETSSRKKEVDAWCNYMRDGDLAKWAWGQHRQHLQDVPAINELQRTGRTEQSLTFVLSLLGIKIDVEPEKSDTSLYGQPLTPQDPRVKAPSLTGNNPYDAEIDFPPFPGERGEGSQGN